MFGLSTKIAIAAVLVSVVSGGVLYIKALKAELQVAAEVQAKQQEVIVSKEKAMAAIQEDVKRMADATKKLEKEKAEAEKHVSDLKRKFSDFSKAATEKPDLIERKINRGTASALRCNELVSGAELTEDEKTGKLKNNICPDLIKEFKK
jgi:predicted RNase H-like nuclease (RuvC/YqgF family)